MAQYAILIQEGFSMFQIMNLTRPSLGQQAAQYTCPPDQAGGMPVEGAFAVSVDPTLNCMRDARGNTICSDGMRYPPGCPKTPSEQYFSPGITPDVTTNGMIEGAVPAPRGASPTPSMAPTAPATVSKGPSPVLLVAGGALGAAAIGAAAYFLLKK